MRYQDVAHDTYRHIMALTRAGEFEGHQAARTVMVHLAMMTAVKDDPARDNRAGHVMGGCVSIPSITESTRLSKSAVSKSLRWLAQNGFIQVVYLCKGNRRRIFDIRVTSYSSDTEEVRKQWVLQQNQTVS